MDGSLSFRGDEVLHGPVGGKETRPQGVDPDPTGAPLTRQVLGQVEDSRLGDRIGKGLGQRGTCRSGADVDYRPPALLDEVAPEHLTTEHRSSQLDSEDVVPLGHGNIKERGWRVDARTVDDPVQATEMANRGFQNPSEAFLLPNVKRQCNRSSAVLRDLNRDLLGLYKGQVTANNTGSSSGKRASHGTNQEAAGPGEDVDAVAEQKQVRCVRRSADAHEEAEGVMPR